MNLTTGWHPPPQEDGRVFPTGGMGGGVVPPPVENLLIPPTTEKIPTSRLFPHQILIPTSPTKS